MGTIGLDAATRLDVVLLLDRTVVEVVLDDDVGSLLNVL